MERNTINVFEGIAINRPRRMDRKVSLSDLNIIWKNLSDYVRKMLRESKSVSVKDVGVFGLKKWVVNAGIQQDIKHLEQVFIISKTLAEDFDLNQRKQYMSDNIPLATMNLYEIANRSALSKDQVALGLSEITQCLRRLVAKGSNVKLEFPGLGELIILNKIITFSFKNEIKPSNEPKIFICDHYQDAKKPFYNNHKYPCEFHSTKSK